MSVMKSFVAFRAVIGMLEDSGQEDLIEEVYQKCKAQENFPKEKVVNYVKELYDAFSAEQISQRIAQIVKPTNISFDFEILFQSIEGLHAACSENIEVRFGIILLHAESGSQQGVYQLYGEKL